MVLRDCFARCILSGNNEDSRSAVLLSHSGNTGKMTKYLTLAFFGQILILMISTQCYPLGPSSSPFGHTASLNHGSFFPLKQYRNWPHSSSRSVITGKQQTLTLNVTGLKLFCSKSQCHSHHKECRLEVDYSFFSEGISTSKIRFSSGLHSATTRKLSTLISNPSNAGSKE